MSSLTIEAKKRELIGKNNAGRLRRDGNIPANLIGKGKAQSLQVPVDKFDRMLAAGLRQSQVIDMNLDGENLTVIVKEIQRDPVNSKVQHIDFIQVENGKKASLKIAIETKGIANGVKMGGALEHFVRHLKIKAIPESFQDCIEVDISNMDINDNVKLSDLNIPDSWDVLLEGNPLVLKIAPGRILTDEDDEEDETSETSETSEEGAEKTEEKTEEKKDSRR